jgi:abequosyltransferase
VKENKTMARKLSICMPVYNCAEFLGQALDSILPQTDEQVEVIVYDGGSTDGSRALMEGYIKTWPNLFYHRASHRGGIDADMATCVGLAQGEYCWLFSGDDVMRAGAIKRALEWIKKGDDVYLCKHTICNKQMDILHDHPVLTSDNAFVAQLLEPTSRQDWFRRAQTTEAFFSFISGLVVRAEKWHNGRLPDEFKGSCWGHVARLFGLINSGLSVCYVAEVWLDQRGGNDSFADKGVVNRYRIAIDGYNEIADAFFGHDSIEAFHIRRVIRNEFGLIMFLSAKLLCKIYPMRENRELLDNLVRKIYGDISPYSILKQSIYILTPVWMYALGRNIYKRMWPN